MAHAQQNFNHTVIEFFEAQVQKTPHNIALQDRSIVYTYAALNEKANQFAQWLEKNSVNQGDFVAILLEPNANFIICIIAIIKLGAIYVPLDTMAPKTRLQEITTDSNPKIVITSEEYKDQLNKTRLNSSLIKHIHLESISYSKDDLKRAISPRSPIYLMYTSGSTGKPKGIVIPHNAVVNLVKTDNYADANEDTIMAQFSNLAFDACTFEIWSALLNGALLSIIPASIRANYNDLKTYLRSHKINCLFLPTGYFHQLVKSFPETLTCVEKIIFGGEQVNPVLIKNFLTYRKINKLPVTLINGYGPTESTTFTCRHIMTEKSELDDDALMSIGNPISHVKTYILDEHKNQVTEGELYISGINLALGYHNSPVQNQEKFLNNPFEQEEPYKQIYKTGDNVTVLPSGKLLCLGRVDDQVKIGGFRIHLNEIEKKLMKHEAISLAAVVVDIGGGFHKILTAYIVFSSKKAITNADDIRSFLSLHLPPYMLPARYVVVEDMPLTLIGKVDKKNLSTLPHSDLTFHVDTSTSSIIEETIKKIWKHLLNRSTIETNKNLFELGANSLLMTEACSRINNELQAELQMLDMLTYPTIHRLSRFLEGDLDVPVIRQQHTMNSSDIAIIGMSCRFPKANSLEEFWENLCQGKECLERFTQKELDNTDNRFQQENFVPVRGVLSDIEQFDANFFGFSPMDASLTDPQQRLFLECAWEALEHAGVVPSQMGSKTISVFAGMTDSTYWQENLLKNSWVRQELDHFQQRIASSLGMLSTQVSYRLNLKGRSLNINTACSTGLVTVAQACQELMMGTSDVALAGAVSIVVPQIDGYVYQQGGIESPNGQCRPFEKNAQGTVFSNGLGVVILKRLKDALSDNDTIYAVIKGVGVNNDGSDKLGYMAPSVHGQISCIREALMRAGVTANKMGYLEAHGTATALGDVVEMKALSTVYREQTDHKNYCALGSVKGNIGHTDVASGMAGLIKTVLCLYHKKIPPMPNFEHPHPNINLEESPFFINSQLLDWQKASNQRYAGVSSFGVGGTNVHMVLSEYVHESPTSNSRSEHLMVVSAKTETALRKNTAKLIQYLENPADKGSADLANIAYTLQTGREAFQWRCFGAGHNREELIKNLSLSKMTCWDNSSQLGVIFMFSGQGMQYHQMASQLMNEIPFFASLVQRGIHLAKPHLGVNLLDIINNPLDERLHQTHYAQPALFIIEYALANLLIHYGLKPDAMIGHSIGEYVAACLAGIFSFEDAIALVCQRGLLMASIPAGEMLVSGKEPERTPLERSLLKKGKSYQKIEISHDVDCQTIKTIQKSLKDLFSNITLSAPKIPIISNVSGTWLTTQEATNSDYWYKHLRHTAQFCKGLETLLEDQRLFFIEVGPGQSLNLSLKELAHQHKKKIICTNTLRLKKDLKQLFTVLGISWQHGITITWPALYENRPCRHVPLPTYAFQKQWYWVDAEIQRENKKELVSTSYKPVWSHQQAYTKSMSLSSARLAEHSWIIFKDNMGLSDRCIALLEKNNIKPIVIAFNKTYAKKDTRYFNCNPANKHHYLHIIQSIKNTLKNPIILHFASYFNQRNTLPSPDEIDEQLTLGFYSILYLSQAFIEIVGSDIPVKIAVITTGTQQVLGTELINPINATLNGSCRVIMQEHDNLMFRLVDLDSTENPQNNHRLLSTILESCLDENWDEASLISPYRNERQWSLMYGIVNSRPENKQRLKDNGIYLLTGGIGGIALCCCEAIVKSVSKPTFLLLSRSTMPLETEWELILQKPNHTYHEKIKQIRTIQKLGATFLFFKTDITQFESLDAVITQCIEQFGKINGLIHTAGVTHTELVQLKSRANIQDVFLPKIHGTYNLIRALKNVSLDFVVLKSSLAAFLGGFGHVDYCGANACLDSFASSNLFPFSSFIVSINWNTWREVGIAAKAIRKGKPTFLWKGNAISPQQGQALFLQALQGNESQVAISNRDINLDTSRHKLIYESISPPIKMARHNLNVLTNYQAPENDMECTLVELWEEMLGVKRIGVTDDFFVFGGHSLMALNLIEKINKIFSCSLAATQIYRDPTIKQLCSIIVDGARNNI